MVSGPSCTIPNGVAGPGKVLPSPRAVLVLAPMSGLMKEEVEAARGWARSDGLSQKEEAQSSEPFAKVRRERGPGLGRASLFMSAPVDRCGCEVRLRVKTLPGFTVLQRLDNAGGELSDACGEGADGPDCLTARQAQTADTMLSPATAASGEVVFPRLEPATELEWARLAGGPAPADLFLDQFRYVVYQDPNWDWRTFDLERDSGKANAIDEASNFSCR